MAGKFDDTAIDFKTSTSWTPNIPHRHDGSNIDMDKNSGRSNDINPMTTNTIAAVVSALLATTFLFLIVFIIRVIRKRRQQRLSNRFGPQVVQTITPSNFGASANVAAFRNVPIAGGISWENVATSSAPVLNTDHV